MPEAKNGSPFVKWALGIVGTLTVLGIVSGFKFAIAQTRTDSDQEARIEQVEETQKENRAAVQAVPVIQRDIEYIQGDLEDVKVDVKDIKAGIEEIKAAVKK